MPPRPVPPSAIGRVAVLAAVVLLAAACGDGSMSGGGQTDGMGQMSPGEQRPNDSSTGMGSMADMGEMADDVAQLPPVFGYFDGEELFFVHPEASDAQAAEMLSGMMDSPVILVPSLADVPDDAVADLYAFTNGVRPEDTPSGPFGFQPDVFDSVPGDDAYRPLRRLVRVSWTDEDAARVLTSVGEIRDAERAGEATVEETSVVINAPMLSWPGGSR